MIKCRNIIKKYKSVVIKDFSYEFLDYGFYTIFGDSGSGKTTLLNIISGLDNSYVGEVKIDDVNLSNLDNYSRSKFVLKNIGYVFQDFALLNLLSVFDNVLFNLDALSNLSKEKKISLVNEALEFVGLSSKKDIAINKLSGGEQQRVAIARAIVTSPKYLLCDEPTGNLDNKNTEIIFNLLKEYSKEHVVILVSHDKENVFNYSDVIICLKDGAISEIINNNELINKDTKNLNISCKHKLSLSLPLLFRSGLKKIKEKKYRSIFTNFVSSLSLLALGISILISSSLKGEIMSSFSNVINSNEILVTKKNQKQNPYTSYIATSDETSKEIANTYSDYIYGRGVTYLSNINGFFPDRDQLYLEVSKEKRIVLPSFFASKFNSYVWKEEKIIDVFFPRVEREMEIDDVILGLTYSDMIDLTSKLEIERSYLALGSYISTHQTLMGLGVDNLLWGYENDVYLNLLSVYPSSTSEIYHTSHYFNEYIFEECCRFPTTYEIEKDPELPWTLKKVYTLHSIEAPTELIEAISYNDKYDDLIFERSENFLNDSCILTDTCPKNAVFLFTIDKNAVDISDVIYFKKVVPNIENFYVSSNAGYQMHSSGMIAGFINNVGFSFIEDKIVELGDLFSKQLEGEIENVDKVAIGSISRANNNGVMFSSDLSNISRGELPKNYNEIVVSSGLIRYLKFVEDPLYKDMFYCSYSKALDSVIINKFRIVGIVENDKNYLYHYPLFTVSFFRDKLGVSSFNLIPTNMVLSLNKNADVSLAIDKLSNSFKEYTFACPLLEIGKTVDEVMNYVSIVAILFALVALVISIMLLSLISYLNAIESKKEITLLTKIGHSKSTITQYIISHSLVTGIITTAISTIEIFIVEILMSIVLGNVIGSGIIKISISFLPIVIVILVGLSLPILISYLVIKVFMRKKYEYKKIIK